MIYGIYPTSDATIYEYYPLKNTGLDAILDLAKLVTTSSVYNNRVLIKFDLTSISSSIVQGSITNPKFYLNLYTTDIQEVPYEYIIEAYPISQSWTSGNGRYISKPENQLGVSWTNRSKTNAGEVAWTTSSFTAGTTGNTLIVSGGGTWYTDYTCTQSYNATNSDIRIEVTSIVNDWLNGTIPNNGFIIKKSHADETSTSAFGTLQYFSSDSQTVYTPKLEVAWDNATFSTGSLTQPNSAKELTIYMPTLKKAYNQQSKIKFDVKVREKYPTITFATQSNYLSINYLPSSSFEYSVRYADTDEVVIPFNSTYTKVSCESNGNFFNLWLDSLYAEKYYKFVFKTTRDGSEEYHDNNYIFKVTK